MAKLKWPKNDLGASIEVARAIQHRGGGQVDADQLAALLGYKDKTSGAFGNRVAAARMFGLIEGQSPRIRATDVALQIIDPVYEDQAVDARVRAFRNVPLFRAFFDVFRGKELPKRSGLDNALKTQFGISERDAPTVRARLLNSADEAGLFQVAGSRTRMVLPLQVNVTDDGDEPGTQAATAKSPDATEPAADVPKVVIGALEAVPWSSSLDDSEIDQVIGLIQQAIRLHFTLSGRRT